MSCYKIEWVKKERRVWNMERMEMCSMEFLQFDVNDELNTMFYKKSHYIFNILKRKKNVFADNINVEY